MELKIILKWDRIRTLSGAFCRKQTIMLFEARKRKIWRRYSNDGIFVLRRLA